MIYASVPKDLSKIKPKILFNLTKRQLICFGAGAAVGFPFYFLLKDSLGASAASMGMILLMLPFFLLALYEKNGRPLEKILWDILQFYFVYPRRWIYKTQNFYTCLMKQAELCEEVNTHDKTKTP